MTLLAALVLLLGWTGPVAAVAITLADLRLCRQAVAHDDHSKEI